MKKTPVEAVNPHKASPKLVRYSDNLKDGSPVLVRILGSRGNGKYEASVAGVRILLSSERNLQPGDTLTGRLSLKNGFISIIPDSSSALSEMKEVFTASFLETGDVFETVSSPALASLLSALNLPPDNLSFRILQQFKQLGMKFDPATMKKIRLKAAKSENPQKTLEEETEKAQKRILSDSIPSIFDNQNFPENQKKENGDNSSPFPQDFDWLKEVKSFVNSLLSGELQNNPGELTLKNHLGFFKDRTSENSWITIPFEITNPFEETVTGNGKILLLLGSSDKAFRQMNLQINFWDSEYRFLLGTKGSSSKISRILYALSGKAANRSQELEEKLHTLTQNVKQVPFDLIDGTGSRLEDFPLAEGLA
ncbi:MAG: hypothetical protein MJ181_00585 [Treponema sp.]|nr:hypothetical protein [Treponema sp.]